MNKPSHLESALHEETLAYANVKKNSIVGPVLGLGLTISAAVGLILTQTEPGLDKNTTQKITAELLKEEKLPEIPGVTFPDHGSELKTVEVDGYIGYRAIHSSFKLDNPQSKQTIILNEGQMAAVNAVTGKIYLINESSPNQN